MSDIVSPDRLRTDLAKYDQSRKQLAEQLTRIENAKAEVLAQLNAHIGAMQALTALLPSELAVADTDTGSEAAAPTDGAAPEPSEAYTNGRA